MIRAEYFMRDPRISHSTRLIRKPDISIILPTYCRGESGLLKRAIDSVLSQSLASFELIVMDDGSTDGTADLLSAYVKSDDRVIHVRHDNNCGLPALRVNEGLLMARGDICAYQFDDDLWANTFLANVAGELRKNPRYEVAYGLCKSTYDGSQHMLGGPFNYAQLLAGNFIANNTVVHRRTVFERLGGYDMHLVMRRLCDWDLWMRWARDAAFLSVHDEVMSTVDGGLIDSLAKTVSVDNFLVRAQMALDRNGSLRPGALKSYPIDNLDHLKHLGERKVNDAWRQQVAPFQSKFRHIWTAVRPPRPKPLHVLVVKAHFDITIDITINNFADMLAGDFVFTFVPLGRTDDAAIRCADLLLLHGASDRHAHRLAKIARKEGKAVVLLMDDDLTSRQESGLDVVSMERVIRVASMVVTYSRLAQESIQALNPRNVVMEVNIRRQWMAAAKSNLKERSSRPEPSERPVRIGFIRGWAGSEDLAVLWAAIVQASRQLGGHAEFKFWDFTPDGLEHLHSPYHCEQFTQQTAVEFERALQPSNQFELSPLDYAQYLGRLASGNLDVIIAPSAKSPLKFLEITAAGAVGIYSDVDPYRVVAEGVSGIKCQNTVEGWSAAIVKAASFLPAERNCMVGQAIEVIERDYTTEAQAPRLAATLEAAVLHGLLDPYGSKRSRKPRIAYFCHSPYLAGAEISLLRHATIAQAFQFEPLLVLPSAASTMVEEIQRSATALGIAIAYLPLTVETETDELRKLDESAVAEIRHWLQRSRIALVHSVTLMREVGAAAGRLGIPHATSLFATKSRHPASFHHCDVVQSDSLLYANRWAEVLGVPARRIMSAVPDEFFHAGPSPRTVDGNLTLGIFATLQARKGQLQAVEAVGLLKKQFGLRVHLRLHGYDHFYPDYLDACKEMARRYEISDLLSFSGFTSLAAPLCEVDILLCASDWESLPLTILEAMAAGRLVIAPNVGGIGEVVSQRTGILMPDNAPASICQAIITALQLTPDEWRNRTDLAREVVREECSKYKVAAELFRLYSQAAATQRGRSKVSGVVRTKLDLAHARLANFLVFQRHREQSLNAEIAGARTERTAAAQDAERWRMEMAAAVQDAGRWRTEMAAAVQDADRWKEALTASRRSLTDIYKDARTLPPPALQAVGLVPRSPRPSPALREQFIPLWDYCSRHFHTARASLVLGRDLNEVPYLEYEIPFDVESLRSVSLAIRPLLPRSSGLAAIEIVSSKSEILLQAHMPLADIAPGEVTEFRLPVPLTSLHKSWLLRVFVLHAEGQVPVYELAQGTLVGGPTRFFPFVLFK